MGAVVEFVEDVVGGAVEAVGDVVESVVDVIDDVAVAVDEYVIQPILDDPVTAVATAVAATYLGPVAATYFGQSAAVGAGIAAAAGNTAAGLAQGESFDEAIKGGAIAGLSVGASTALFGGAGPEAATPAPTDSLDDFLAANNNFVDVPMDSIAATTSPVRMGEVATTDLPPLGSEAAATTPVAPEVLPSPLQTQATSPIPEAATPSPLQTAAPAAAPQPSTFTPDYSLTSGMESGAPGLKVPDFTPADAFDIYGNPNYSLTPGGTSAGPGLQIPDAPNLPRMGGGQGLTADMSGLPQYMENGAPTTFQGANGQTYGNPTPDVTVGATGSVQTPPTIAYDATTNMGTPSVMDQVASGNFTDAAKTIGNKAVDWYKGASPWEVAGAGLAGLQLLGGTGGPPTAAPPTPGSTRDPNFNKSLDLYKYLRDQANYGGDLTRYGQAGQANPGEHQFFQNTKFVPIPIPGQEPRPAKMGGLIQMKHFAQGGMAQGMQDPRRAQMMAAMAQQRPAGQGRPPMMPQNAQGMPPQGRPQMPQRPRDPKTAYYQYGQVPTQAKAMGGLSQVHSMKIGGGADGRSDDVNAVLSDGEYVFDAESVAMLGNGSSKAGAAKLDQMRSKLRQHKGKNLASGKISPNAKSPLAYLKGA